MEYEAILQEVGLNKNEAIVWLWLLKHGQSKASEIYNGTKIQRTFIYEIIKNLIDKGLVSYVIKSGVKYYEAADPYRLKFILQERQAKFDKIFPELISMKKVVIEKPAVELYEGKEGLKSILENILKMKKGDTMYAYANNDLFDKLQFYFPNFVKRRIKAKIYAKVIQEKAPYLVAAKKISKKELRELKFSPTRFKTSVFIWEDKIALMVLKEDLFLGVMIKNKEIAETQKQVFELLWRLAE